MGIGIAAALAMTGAAKAQPGDSSTFTQLEEQREGTPEIGPDTAVTSTTKMPKPLDIGKVPFRLVVDDCAGELRYEFSPDKKLDTVWANKGVVFTTDETTITAESLTYDVEAKTITASGPDLKALSGKAKYTADNLTYMPESGELVLVGNAKVVAPDVSGNYSITTAEKMKITNIHVGPLPHPVRALFPQPQ